MIWLKRRKKNNTDLIVAWKIVTANIEIFARTYHRCVDAAVRKTWRVNVMVVSHKVKRLILWVSDVKFNDRSDPECNLQPGRTLLSAAAARKRRREAS